MGLVQLRVNFCGIKVLVSNLDSALSQILQFKISRAKTKVTFGWFQNAHAVAISLSILKPTTSRLESNLKTSPFWLKIIICGCIWQLSKPVFGETIGFIFPGNSAKKKKRLGNNFLLCLPL